MMYLRVPFKVFGEPPLKRSRVNEIGVNVPYTAITKPQKLARVKNEVKAIYTNADDEAFLALRHGEVNAFYESWLEVCDYPEYVHSFSLFNLLISFLCFRRPSSI